VENIYTRAKSDLSKKQTALEDTRQKTAAFEAQSKNQIVDMKNDKMSRGIDPSQLLGWINKEAQIMTTIEKKNNQLVADQYAVNDFQEVVKEHKLAYQKAMRKLEKIECLKQIMTEE
jgi:DNA gyrase/topoisomerase IV subunit B